MTDTAMAPEIGHVWLVEACRGDENIAGIQPDPDPKNLEAAARARSGYRQTSDHFPTAFYAEFGNYLSTTPKLKTSPPLFKAGPFPMVSDEMAGLLRDFDLGHTELREVELYKKDRKTPAMQTRYWGLYPGEVKDTFLPQASYGLSENRRPPPS